VARQLIVEIKGKFEKERKEDCKQREEMYSKLKSVEYELQQEKVERKQDIVSNQSNQTSINAFTEHPLTSKASRNGNVVQGHSFDGLFEAEKLEIFLLKSSCSRRWLKGPKNASIQTFTKICYFRLQRVQREI
jgi:hypothetical protein